MGTLDRFALVAAVAGASAACGGAQPTTGPAAQHGRTGSAECLPSEARPAFRPIGDGGASSTVALADYGGRTVAFVADEDARAVHVVDVDAGKQLSTTALDAIPSHLLALEDGRLLVALRDSAAVRVLEASARPQEAMTARCTVETAAEPVALARTPDRATVLVTSGWGRKLTALDTRTLARRFEVELPREPRGVVVSDDGTRAFVSHAVGVELSVVALPTGKREAPVALKPRDSLLPVDSSRRTSCQGYALAKSVAPGGRVLVPQVFVDPGDLDNRAAGYGDENAATEVAGVAVVDEGTAAPLAPSLTVPFDGRFVGQVQPARAECLLPRAAAVDAGSGSLLVTCFGIDALVAYDAAAANPARAERRRWNVGAGPSGVAVQSSRRRAVVWSQFDRRLDVIPLAGLETLVDEASSPPTRKIALAPAARPLGPDLALGRQLFHRVGDGRISRDGRACASCHPEGRDDAITWATPNGPRRTAMLAGRIPATAPYGWDGEGKNLEHHLEHTFERLGGTGLTSIELRSLLAYVSTLAPPPAPAASGDALANRGEAIFRSERAGCASCHASDRMTDGKRHDVRTQAKADKAATFDTPSLRFVGGRAPYFHDGRYASLRALLTGSDGSMGHTGHLSEGDLDALEAYLRSL